MLGDSFEIMEALLSTEYQKKEVCHNASSRPDVAFFHVKNFVNADTMYAASLAMKDEISPDDPDDINDEKHRLLGWVGEDKVDSSLPSNRWYVSPYDKPWIESYC